MNIYQMLQEVRSNVNEPEETTNGRWTDLDLVRKLNSAYQIAWSIVGNSPGDRLVTSTDLTPSSGVITLPTDFRRFVYMEEKDSRNPIFIRGTVRERSMERNSVSHPDFRDFGGYLLGDTIVISNTEFASEVTLWYEPKLIKLLTATADTGSTTNSIIIPLASQPNRGNDYYNGVYLEAFDGTGEGTRAVVTDYVASTRALTVAGSWSTDTVFGMESQLPEEADMFMILHATVLALASPGAAFDQRYFEFFSAERLREKNALEEAMAERIVDSGFVRIYEID